MSIYFGPRPSGRTLKRAGLHRVQLIALPAPRRCRLSQLRALAKWLLISLSLCMLALAWVVH